jgi:hypothetical protein
MRRRIISGFIVAASLATAGIAYAENQPTDPSVSSTAPAVPGEKATAPKATKPRDGAAQDGAAKDGRKAGVLKGAIHGDLLVRNEDGSTRTVTFDRGEVTAISAGSITIERPDKVSVSQALNDQTVFNGTPRDQLKAGTGVIVISEGHTAQRVLSKGAAKARAKAACVAAPAGEQAGNGGRNRIKARLCERLEKRQDRRAGKGTTEGQAGQGKATDPGGDAAEAPAAGPASMVDDGFETILS